MVVNLNIVIIPEMTVKVEIWCSVTRDLLQHLFSRSVMLVKVFIPPYDLNMWIASELGDEISQLPIHESLQSGRLIITLVLRASLSGLYFCKLCISLLFLLAYICIRSRL